jgi:hypothetical protein
MPVLLRPVVAGFGAGFLLLALAGCGGVAPQAEVGTKVACYPPPELSDPLTFVGACPGDAGFPDVIKAGGRDVLVRLPTNAVCHQALHVAEAGNVRIVGGSFLYTGSAPAVVTVSRSAGTAFIEGLNIDVAGQAADAIRVYSHTGRLIVQNTFARRISGRPSGPHGDLVHAQGGGPLNELILQNVTGYSGYQGLFTPYRPASGHGTHALTLERVNVAYDPSLNRSSGAAKPLKLLFMGSADDPADLPPDRGTTLSQVYVDTSYWNVPFERALEPRPRTTFGRCVTFDDDDKIAGSVCRGAPPGGDFAPAALVGGTYDRAHFCADAAPSVSGSGGLWSRRQADLDPLGRFRRVVDARLEPHGLADRQTLARWQDHDLLDLGIATIDQDDADHRQDPRLPGNIGEITGDRQHLAVVTP